MAELILTRLYNQYIDVMLCGMRKQNGMIRRHD